MSDKTGRYLLAELLKRVIFLIPRIHLEEESAFWRKERPRLDRTAQEVGCSEILHLCNSH